MITKHVVATAFETLSDVDHNIYLLVDNKAQAAFAIHGELDRERESKISSLLIQFYSACGDPKYAIDMDAMVYQEELPEAQREAPTFDDIIQARKNRT